MEKKLFQLVIGNEFTLNKKDYVVRDFVRKWMPKLGNVLNCICEEKETGKQANFTRNWTVITLNKKGQ